MNRVLFVCKGHAVELPIPKHSTVTITGWGVDLLGVYTVTPWSTEDRVWHRNPLIRKAQRDRLKRGLPALNRWVEIRDNHLVPVLGMDADGTVADLMILRLGDRTGGQIDSVWFDSARTDLTRPISPFAWAPLVEDRS